MPDEVPTERAPVPGVLRLEVLSAVLADDLDACLGERPELLEGDVLRRGDDRDAGARLRPDRVVARPDLLS
jgi:hypothetical protein